MIFLALEEHASATFPSEGRTFADSTKVEFNVCNSARTTDGFYIDKRAYNSVLIVDFERNPPGYTTARRRESYAIASSQSGVLSVINQSAQCCADLADLADYKALAEATRLLQNLLTLTIHKLDLDTAELCVCCDASWANNRDLSSQLG